MESLAAKIQSEIVQWEASQRGQTSGYEYEASFVNLWHRLGQEVFQQSVGELPRRVQQKKTSHQHRNNNRS